MKKRLFYTLGLLVAALGAGSIVGYLVADGGRHHELAAVHVMVDSVGHKEDAGRTSYLVENSNGNVFTLVLENSDVFLNTGLKTEDLHKNDELRVAVSDTSGRVEGQVISIVHHNPDVSEAPKGREALVAKVPE